MVAPLSIQCEIFFFLYAKAFDFVDHNKLWKGKDIQVIYSLASLLLSGEINILIIWNRTDFWEPFLNKIKSLVDILL